MVWLFRDRRCTKMACKHLDNTWLKGLDENGDVVGSWCEQGKEGYFRCKRCGGEEKSFKHGKKDILSHARSKKHKDNKPKSDSISQPTLQGYFGKDKEENVLKTKVENLAIYVTGFFARHDVPFEEADCFTNTLKKAIDDSEIVKKLKLGADKMKYIAKYGLGEEFRKQTVDEMKNAIAFALSLDESEVNKVSQLEIVAKICTKEGNLELKHYATIDIEGTDAKTIVEAVTDQLTQDGIDFKTKMVDVGVDGCNTMIGEHSGVVKRFQDIVPQMPSTGSCSAHNLTNVMKHGVTSFDPDLKELLVDLYQDIGGSKGKGLKRMKDFQNSCYNRGFIPKPILRFVDTRFRSFRTCTEPVLENWEEIVFYYSNVDKQKKKTDRQNRIIEMIVKREEKTRLSLMFINAATLPLSQKIDYFEQNKVHIDTVSDVLESILVDEAKKIFVENVVMTMDEDGDISNKSRFELASLDVEKAEILSRKEMFIGTDTKNHMKKLDLSPSASKMDWFFEGVMKFYKTVVKYLLKYFSKALLSPVMDSFSGLSQKKRSSFGMAAPKLKNLVTTYPKVVSNIDSADGNDIIISEINKYVCDDEIKEFEKNMEYEEYWKQVGSLMEGGSDWPKYEVLPKFALAMGVKFISNSEVERKFSQQNHIHSNKSRNKLNQRGLDSCLHIKSGIESRSAREDCTKCKTKTAHCHCSSFVITTHIREECSKARGRYEDYRQIVNSEKVVQNEAFVKKREKAEGDVKEKFERRKVKIANKMNYFSAQLDPVYDKNKKKKSVKDVVDSEKAPNNNNNSDSRKRKNNNPSVSSTMAKASKK